jgi:hypothetical protein
MPSVYTNVYTFRYTFNMTNELTTTPTTTPTATMRRMAKPPMIQRTYKVPEKLYEDAMDKAAEREENLSDVIREALERYAYGEGS